MILIVDDKHENLFSLKTLLQLHGYNKVDTAASGEEALRKILKNEYVLIILDVQMPEMDGFEVAETITGYSKTKNIPIIFLSAVNIDKRFIAKGYASGGVDYVVKPFDPDLLLLKVKTFYRLYQQTEELNQMKKKLENEVAMRKKAQEELEKMNARLEEKVRERTIELERSNSELQQYASVASHDLQEPLRKIITFGRMLSEYKGHHPETAPYLEKMIASSERMRNLINDLLHYSKLSSAINFSYADLNEILQESLDNLELSIQEKNAEITTQPLPHAEVIPGQMRQVFQNIISNALKFSKPGDKPRIRIEAALVNEKSIEAKAGQQGNFVRITITDNGIGFNQVYAEKIFSLFQRLHGKEEYEGTGIGLAIVKKIIEKHNGLLAAESKEGQGTAIIVLLPLKQTQNSHPPKTHP